METKLKLPTWDDIKNLPRDNEYILILFDFDSIYVYGRITLFEDCTNRIHFDVMEGGYSDKNSLGLSKPFTKKGFSEICKHAQKVYEQLIKELLSDRSWMWQEEIKSF